MKTDRILTEYQDKFVENVNKGLPIDEAIKDAGYQTQSPVVTATKLLNKRRIQEAINERWEARTIYGKTAIRTGIKASVDLLRDVLKDSDAPLKIRLKAAQEILDRAGIVSEKNISQRFNIAIDNNFNKSEKQELQNVILTMQKSREGVYEKEDQSD